jgi:hypothetical protein
MLKHLFIFLIFIIFSEAASGQLQKLQSFIPKDFTILDSASGDINKDGKKDWVVILRNDYERINADTARPLLLLLGNGKGEYKLAERNDSIFLCLACGGVFGDPYAGIKIKNNFFSIEHYRGNNWRWTRIVTFKYDIKSRQFILYRDAGDSYHTSEPNKTTRNMYNKEDFGKLLFSKFSYNKGW